LRRGDFLLQGAALAAGASLPTPVKASPAPDPFDPTPGAWGTFEIETAVVLPNASGSARVWVPVPAFEESAWMRPGAVTWTTNASSASIQSDPGSGVKMLCAQWTAATASPTLTVKALASSRDRRVALDDPKSIPPLDQEQYRFYTSATKLQPTDGIVKTTAEKITAGASSDLEKAQLIYAWIVANTYRKPTTRGCGLGDVAFMLETGDLGGKCADINALNVALARASGLAARDLYGIRVAPSRFGYKSLGANSANVTKAQHCRSEVYVAGYGWVPSDPADVRKVMLEEPPGHLPLTNPKVVDARRTLFGAWEGNWIAYNDGRDVALPGSSGPELGFLMYPQAEVAGQREDSLSPEDFVYTITAREIATS
jgi:transglutaminase-like putative cysteine protease